MGLLSDSVEFPEENEREIDNLARLITQKDFTNARKVELQGWKYLFDVRIQSEVKTEDTIAFNIAFAWWWRFKDGFIAEKTYSPIFDIWYRNFIENMKVCWQWSDTLSTHIFVSPCKDLDAEEYFATLLGEVCEVLDTTSCNPDDVIIYPDRLKSWYENNDK